MIPNGKQVSELVRKEGLTVHDIPIKHRLGTAAPYIDLFEEITSVPARYLPIKRIIVGPGINSQETNKKLLEVKKLIEQHNMQVDITVSEIPYLG